MRTSILLILCMGTLITKAQKKEKAEKIEKYYDYQWHECDIAAARFYGMIIKTDSGWHRQDYFIHDLVLQMNGDYDDSACKIPNGKFYYFYPNKQLENYGRYIHGKKQGLWLTYHPNGMMSDSVYYDNNNVVGVSLGWYPDGNPKDSANFQPDGSGLKIDWFNNGNPSSAGRFVNWTAAGKWQFFHPNGKISALEIYTDGKLTEKQYFDENGMPADTTNHDHPAEFAGGASGWQRYLENKLFFPPQYKITNADKAVVVVTFTVNEDGKVQDAYVSTPFYPQFDQIALNVVNKSPLWKPAVQHNRRVKYSFIQAVTFSQEEQ